ncbi:probable serine hydrolase isoform X2 [Periplaneta americana]|uniref:probable serine hydrolase isoform X2 n=1 Tax=Periplaneta americana TaxID=6978 RepID=UPI0037E79997
MKMLKLLARTVWKPSVEALNLQKAYIHNIAAKPLERQVYEVQIPVPWGHIAGKWWGSQDTKPVLCLHGYQDNAGTWDRLAPLLPQDISLLAVDLPGHGLSSQAPLGAAYHVLDFILTIRRIANYYGWERFSLLGHSFGSILSFLYSAIFPEHVEKYVALDAIKPLKMDPARRLKKHGEYLDEFLRIESLDPNSKPSYTYDETVNILHKSIGNWANKESCEILTRRGTIRQNDGRYVFSRDPRLKGNTSFLYTRTYVLDFAANIRCEVLNIKAKQGLKFETPEENEEFLEIIKKSAKRYEYHAVEGAHHVHLDHPERVAPIISNFLKST